MSRIIKRFTKVGSALLIAAMLFAVAPKWSDNGNVRADWKKTADNTRIGTDWINNPATPKTNDSPWAGNYVYLGEYMGKPIKFRVLEKDNTDLPIYSYPTMILDSDEVLFNSVFDSSYDGHWDNGKSTSNPNYEGGPYSTKTYDCCSLREYLNNGFLLNHFTDPEFYSIVPVQKIGGKSVKIGDKNLSKFDSWVKKGTLTGDYIYILDVDDVCNPAYGYIEAPGFYSYSNYFTGTNHVSVKNREKNGGSWWLRSSEIGDASIVQDEGYLGIEDKHDVYGVAPALNINMKSIVFTSLISGTAYEDGAEFKLTINDDNMVMTVSSDKQIEVAGNEITVPYELTGADASKATQFTYMITDTKYEAGVSGSVLYMDSLSFTYLTNDGTLKSKGEGRFELPVALDIDKWGEDYFVYVFAEDVNSLKQTDYVSNLVELDKPVAKTVATNINDSATPTPTPTKRPVTPTPAPTRNSQTTANPGNSSNNPGNNAPGSTSSANIRLSMDKAQSYIVCGNNMTLKATLENSRAGIRWKSSNTKVATVDSSGNVTGKMAGNVTITASAAGKTVKCAVTVLYKDVTDGSKFWFEPTNYLTAKGVVKGYDKQTKFKPANDCTRAQMVTFIWRLMGEPSPKTSRCKFSDVKSNDYFYKACIWGNENGIVEGYKDGTFGPQIVCARKHAVTFLWRLAGKPETKNKTNKFSDVKTSDYFYKATLWASEKEILAGYSDGTFRPKGDCLRRQMVTFLYKYDKNINGK